MSNLKKGIFNPESSKEAKSKISEIEIEECQKESNNFSSEETSPEVQVCKKVKFPSEISPSLKMALRSMDRLLLSKKRESLKSGFSLI